GVPTVAVLVISGAATAFGPVVWAVLRRRYSGSSGTRSRRSGEVAERAPRQRTPWGARDDP
ncbi:hypothetical protein, partial [Micropruina sp.]|uniref:hypothetical protein n=1 Tax=Micropruina sp. TaxID=2737536 RepID=UPI00260439D3